MCPPLVSSFFETALVLELCQPCFAFSAILYTYSNIQQFLKMQHVLMYLWCLFDGKMVWILNVILILIFLLYGTRD